MEKQYTNTDSKLVVTLGKLTALRNALKHQVHADKEDGNGNVTDFSYNSANEDSERLLGKGRDGMPQSYVDFIKGNPDAMYNLAVVTGDKIRKEYPHSDFPKGSNELYAKIADDTTPPMTHAELLDRVNAAIEALD